MRNVNVTLEDRVHERLKAFARTNMMTLADALRYALDHCLPELPSEEPDAKQVEGKDAGAEA